MSRLLARVHDVLVSSKPLESSDISVRDPKRKGKSMSVNLNLIAVWLLASPAFASVFTNPSTLNVTWKQGAATPVFANVEIQSTGLFTTAIATNPMGWLGIFPASGNGPTVAIVSIAPQFLRDGA